MNKQIYEKISLLRLYISSILIWSVVISLNVLARYVDMVRREQVFDLFQSLVFFISAYSFWILVTPIFFRFLENQVKQFNKFKLLLSFIVPMLIILPIFSLLDMALMAKFQNIEWSSIRELMAKMPAFFLLFDFLLYIGLFVGCLAIIFYRNSIQQSLISLKLDKQKAELARQLSDVQLTSLQSQLEPHFLFNSLNSISSLVRINDKSKALTAIRQLSELLRYVIAASQKSIVELPDEIGFVKDYIALQSIRYGDKMLLDWQQQGELSGIEVPPFLLHTLLENAIVHGVEKNIENTQIKIEIYVNASLEIIVQNTSTVISNNKNPGIGLNNLLQRLNHVYDDKFEFKTLFDDGIFSAIVSIPVEG